MNYASTNAPESNTGGFTARNPAAMEASVEAYMQSDEFKRKVASKQEASVKRLEDYPADVQSKMIDLYWRGSWFTDVSMHDNGYTALSKSEADLVADYQQRQASAERQPERGADVPYSNDYMTGFGKKWGELSRNDQWYEYRTVKGEKQALEVALQEACMWLQLIGSGILDGVQSFEIAKNALKKVEALRK